MVGRRAEGVAVTHFALVLFFVSLLVCFIAFCIVQRSESIRFILPVDNLPVALRELTNSLLGWLVLALLLQAVSLLFLSAVLPVISALS